MYVVSDATVDAGPWLVALDASVEGPDESNDRDMLSRVLLDSPIDDLSDAS